MKKIILVSALLSLVSFALAVCLVFDQTDGPFFINSNQAIGTYGPMQLLNSQLSEKEKKFNAELSVYEDSVSKVLGLLKVRNDSIEALLDLANMELNIFQHKMIDSVTNSSKSQLDAVSEQFGNAIAQFCKSKNINVLFDAKENTIVFGTNSKADKTSEITEFLSGK